MSVFKKLVVVAAVVEVVWAVSVAWRLTRTRVCFAPLSGVTGRELAEELLEAGTRRLVRRWAVGAVLPGGWGIAGGGLSVRRGKSGCQRKRSHLNPINRRKIKYTKGRV